MNRKKVKNIFGAKYPLECKQCGCVAHRMDGLENDEFDMNCSRCGYHHSQTYEYAPVSVGKMLVEKEFDGYGVSCIVKNDGDSETTFYYDAITDEHLDCFHKQLTHPGVLKEQCYFVARHSTYFKILHGRPPADFFQSYSTYSNKHLLN